MFNRKCASWQLCSDDNINLLSTLVASVQFFLFICFFFVVFFQLISSGSRFARLLTCFLLHLLTHSRISFYLSFFGSLLSFSSCAVNDSTLPAIVVLLFGSFYSTRFLVDSSELNSKSFHLHTTEMWTLCCSPIFRLSV